MVKRILEELDGFHLEGDGFVQEASDELRTWLESPEAVSYTHLTLPTKNEV